MNAWRMPIILSGLAIILSGLPAAMPKGSVSIRPIEPIWDFYTGVLLEVKGPGGNIFWLWPEEYWSWTTEEGEPKGDYIRREFIRDFRQDPATGTITYGLTMAPRNCDIRVEIVPGPDTLTIIHRIDNRGKGTVQGGSPCLQIGRAKDFQSWSFEQAKRTFLWTQQDGFVWLADTRRTGKDVHPANKSFCQNYHFTDPEKMHKAFGRSPDLASSALVGAVSLDRARLIACVGENAQSVAHGLMNCIHSMLHCTAGPGERREFRYRAYFLPNDIEELVRRAGRDFPGLQFPAPDRERLLLAGQPPPLESFEDEKAYPRVRTDRARVEPALLRRLTVEGGAAPTYGVTHGTGAALCEFSEGGSLTVPALFVPGAGDRYFSADLTLPVDRIQAARITLSQGTLKEAREFLIYPAAPRRCVLPVGSMQPGTPVDVTVQPADGKAGLLQVDALSLYSSEGPVEATAIQDRSRASRAPETGSWIAPAKAGGPDARRDPYGGTRAVRARATGYFRAETIGGRWWLITPEGNGFISMGMNHLDLAALKYPDNIHIFRGRYGSSDDRYIREGVAKPLREWGFNTIGWSREVVGGIWMDPKAPLKHSLEWSPRQFRVAGLPYVYNLEFGEFEGFNLNPQYPDVDSKVFEEWADYLARAACTELASDPLLIGYADLPIPNFTLDRPGSWAHGLALDKPADRAKLERIIRRYFEITTAAIRRYDRNHMIFGPRFDRPPNTPDWIVKIAGEYYDAILCNLFVTPEQVATSVAEWHRLSGRPVIISDLLYLAPTHILQVSPKAAGYVPDQAARGEAYTRFAAEVLRQPFVVGVHWCAFLENRTRKSGIKTFLDEPYVECVRRMQDFNLRRVYSTALSAAK